MKPGTENQQWKDDAARTIARLAHDLRNPFATLQSFLNILEMEEYTFKPDELKELCGSLQDAVTRALTLIDERVKEIRESASEEEK
jgi:signal transduction histidine kinase